VVIVASVLAIGGCASMGGGKDKISMPLIAGPQLPAADGTIKVKQERNGNNSVKVEVEHMAAASQIVEGATTYVVWLKPQDGEPENVGVLRLDDKKKGKLETTTAFKDFDVMITAEPHGNVSEPADDPLMTASVREGRATM
jgi:hypothetical protein